MLIDFKLVDEAIEANPNNKIQILDNLAIVMGEVDNTQKLEAANNVNELTGKQIVDLSFRV